MQIWRDFLEEVLTIAFLTAGLCGWLLMVVLSFHLAGWLLTAGLVVVTAMIVNEVGKLPWRPLW